MKIRLYSLIAAMALMLCASSVAVADEKLDAVEKELIKAWEKFESMTADVTMNMNMQGMTNKGTGTFEIDNKGGKDKFRMEMNSEMDMGGQKMTNTTSTVGDGEFVYSVNEAMGQKTAMKMKPGQGQASAPVGRQMFDSLKEQFDLKVLPDETVDGDAAYVLEAKPKQSMGSPIAMMKMYFVKKHGIMVKMRGMDAAGTEVMTMDYKNVKINPKIDASRFVFKAPEGVQVMDMTKQ